MKRTVIEGAYWRDLLEQPAAMERTAALLRASGDGVRGLVAARAFDRVVLTGMGSSYHALHPLQIRLSRAGMFSQMVETSELLSYYPALLGERTLTVAVSQSGESAEVVRLLRDGKAAGPVIGVSNTAGSTLAVESQAAILTAAGPEATVSCKTYVATLQALHWLGGVLVGEDGEAGMAGAQAGVAGYLADWRGHAEWFIEELGAVRQVFVTGRGWSMATAGTGGLILKESVKMAAEGMSSAAFRHGPFEMTTGEVMTCICLGDARTAGLNRRLHSDVGGAGGRSFLLETGAEVAALRLAEVMPELLPIVEILPVQMISLALAAVRGAEAGRFALATKVTAVE
ncbi:MAG: SIS domain-containing protein [Acidobacteria bacterium]|nr:SIS domain-containing protein [Acidobacteriota bacterium]